MSRAITIEHPKRSTGAARNHLYFDDTGNRDPDKFAYVPEGREDRMDWFALGGVIVREGDIAKTQEAHQHFCRAHNITYPLHSHGIRGGRGKFGWLKKPENAATFFPALEEYILSLPIITVACVVNRPGYVARYKEK